MTDENTCKRRGCDKPVVWQQSFAAARNPGYCEEHTYPASDRDGSR